MQIDVNSVEKVEKKTSLFKVHLDNKTAGVNDASSSHFFLFHFFLQLFHFFTLLVAPSSSSLLPPRPSFLLVPPSSLFLFLPRPALSQSLRIHKRPFFIKFDESVTNGRTDRRTDGPTDTPSYWKKVNYVIHFLNFG